MAELGKLNEKLNEVATQNNYYAQLTEKSVKEMEFWRQTAKQKELEINSIKLSQQIREEVPECDPVDTDNEIEQIQ